MKKLDMNIIFAEDEKNVRESLHRMLGTIFTDVHSFENGLEAYEYFQKNGADIIVTDINMPKMNGFDFIEKSKLINPDIPSVVVTAFSDVDNLKTALDLQVDKLLSKPVDIDKLFEALSKIKNILDTKKDLEKERLKLEKFKSAVENSDMIIVVDENFTIRRCNELAKYKLGIKENQDFGILNKYLKKAILEDSYELNNFHTVIEDDKNKLYLSLSSFPSDFKVLKNKLDELYEITFLIRDISDTIRQKEMLIEALYHDELTHLPNRGSLLKDLSSSKIEDYFMMVIDINSFSNINSFYGIDAGDKILKEVALTIKEYLKKSKLDKSLYKLEADKFAVVVKDEDCPKLDDKMFQFSNKLIDIIESKYFHINETDTIKIFVTVGRACSKRNNIITETLLALENAKINNIKNVCFLDYEKEIMKFQDNLRMQTILKKAIDDDNIIPFFQPIVDKEKNIVKYEALARLKDDDKIYTPAQFLDVAKKGAAYSHITINMIKKVFEIFSQNELKVSINLSLLDITNSAMLEFISRMFEKYENMRYRVTFELLESESFNDIQKTIEVCNYLKTLGAKIAIDDFGSGYSNFSYFADLNIDIIKIDGSLAQKARMKNGEVVLRNIISMAKELGCSIIIEYVENEELFEHLKGMNIDMFQGYCFSAPKPWDTNI